MGIQYFENNKSLVAALRAFLQIFIISHHEAVPNSNTIRVSLEEIGVTLKTRKRGRRRYIKTPVNVQLVGAAVERSPSPVARNHAVAFGMMTIV